MAWGSAGDMANAIEIRDDQGRSRAGGGLYQEGQAVFRWATTQIAPVALRAIELAGLTPADIDVFVPHQANLRIVEAVAKRLRTKGARRGHASSPTTSCTRATPRRRRSRWRSTTCARRAVPARGDVVLLVGFGAGLSYAAQVVVLP